MKKPTILIIEDNMATREMLKTTLEMTQNYIVLEARNGLEGLEKAVTDNPDLILQDLFLRDMDGSELNNKLRLLPGLKEIPILALSGFLTGLNEEQNQRGFTASLLKPVEPLQLLEMIKVYLPLYTPSPLSKGKAQQILIADDNGIQLKLLAMQLQNAGFQITTASDGALALEQAKVNPPDGIVSDILMPNLDGFGLCLAVRQDPNLSRIPVILLTSHYLEDADIDLAHKVGATHYMTRTPDETLLIDQLQNCLTNAGPLLTDIPYELETDTKEQHNLRLIRQLEQQVLYSSGLSQRAALQAAQLDLFEGVAESLTNTNKNFDDSLKDVLYSCLDAAGIEKGLLYIREPNGQIKLQQIIGYPEKQRKKLEAFFGKEHLLIQVVESQKPYAIPAKQFLEQDEEDFLVKAQIQSGLLVPLTSGRMNHAVLFLGSDSTNLMGENSITFARTLGMQLGQSMALARAFENLAASEQQHRQLVEISPDAIFIQQEGKFSFVNAAGISLLGAKHSKQILNQPVIDFFQPDYRLALKEYIEGKKTKQQMAFMEGKIVTLDDKIIDVEVVSSPFLYQNKAAIYLIMRNITERKLAELQLEVQYAIAWTLAASATLYEATTQILKVICEQLDWDVGAVWAADNKDSKLHCITIWQRPSITNDVFKKKCLHMTFAPNIGDPGRVWKNRKAIWRSNLHNDFIRAEAATAVGLEMGICFPIIHENEVLGVVEFFNKNVYAVSEDLLSWFKSIGNQFGLFLKRKHMEGQLLYLAEHDTLTGLANRKLIEENLTAALLQTTKNNNKLSVIFIDVDYFKFINDSMGHHVGDLLLIEISQILKNCLRPEDSIGRLGGDEFLVVIPDINSRSDVIPIVERIQKQLQNRVILEGKEFFITTSMGISLYPENGKDVQTLIKNADIALYRAKEKGRNNFQFCTTEMTVRAESRALLQKNLHRALENDEFILYYQPKIDLKTNKTIGLEALLRWEQPKGILLPGEFIYAAEESDLIVPLTEWVLRTACRQNKTWQKEGLPEFSVAINLSINNLNLRLLEILKQILKETELNPHNFEVELTESILMVNIENNIKILNGIKNMGIKIAIDDFGTGYSSLSYLTRFPIDYLKIDQSFVKDIPNDTNKSVIVVAIIAMAHSLGFKVIAEGVETEEQFLFLSKAGVEIIQGYYFSHPLPAKEIPHFLQKEM